MVRHLSCNHGIGSSNLRHLEGRTKMDSGKPYAHNYYVPYLSPGDMWQISKSMLNYPWKKNLKRKLKEKNTDFILVLYFISAD